VYEWMRLVHSSKSPRRDRSSQITIDLVQLGAESTSTLLMKFVAVYRRRQPPDHLIALLATTTGVKFMDGRSVKWPGDQTDGGATVRSGERRIQSVCVDHQPYTMRRPTGSFTPVWGASQLPATSSSARLWQVASSDFHSRPSVRSWKCS